MYLIGIGKMFYANPSIIILPFPLESSLTL